MDFDYVCIRIVYFFGFIEVGFLGFLHLCLAIDIILGFEFLRDL